MLRLAEVVLATWLQVYMCLLHFRHGCRHFKRTASTLPAKFLIKA